MTQAHDIQSSTPIENLEYCRRVFSCVGWFIPPYLSIFFLVRLARRLENSPEQEKLRFLEQELPPAYSPEHLAAMLLHRYSVCPIVFDFKESIGDAIAAFFLGLNRAAVVTLLPAVEGVIRRLGALYAVADERGIKRALLKIVDEAISRERNRNLPAFDERVLMLESLRVFFETHLYEKTTHHRDRQNLNRHGILHGIFPDGEYDTPYNFYRLISVLDQMCFLITVEEGGLSMLAPEDTEASMKLAAFYIGLIAVAPMGRSLRKSTTRVANNNAGDAG